jgi:ABC-type uncharacterized transport system substrate-binding protein
MMTPFRLAAAVATCAVAAACAASSGRAPAAGLVAPTDGGNIVLLKSQDNGLLNLAQASFTAKMPGVTVLVGPTGTDPAALLDKIRASRPRLLVTLGLPATLFARKELPEVPQLFAMVLNQSRHDLGGADNVMGIAMEVAPQSEFTHFKIVLGDSLHRVLTFYGTSSDKEAVDAERMAAMAKELSKANVSLLAVPVRTVEDITQGYKQHARDVNAVWLMNDPLVMGHFGALSKIARQDHVPIVTSLSDWFAHQGALMSVSVDVPSVGEQAAGMARMLLERGMSPKQIGVQPPIGTKVVLNSEIAHEVGLDVPVDVLPYITEMVSEVTSNAN